MDKLHNMSAPPKSSVLVEIKQLDKMIAFEPKRLERLLNCNNKDLLETINKYIDDNKEFELKAPKAYMFALDVNNNLDYEYCDDIDLLICVLGKTSGSIYIPNRQCVINKDKLNKVLYFSKRELYDK